MIFSLTELSGTRFQLYPLRSSPTGQFPCPGHSLRPSTRPADHLRLSSMARSSSVADQTGPGVRPPWGTLNAVDLTTGSVKWKVHLGYYPALMDKGLAPNGTQNFEGCVATLGGLVFKGAAADERFRAFRASDRKELWSFRLPAGGYATPSV